MAILLQDSVTSDQLDCVFSEARPNHLLLICGGENTGKKTAFYERIRHQKDEKKNKILVLTSSEKGVGDVAKELGEDVTVIGFKSLVQKCLGGSKSRYQIITTKTVNYFRGKLKECQEGLVDFERMKKNIGLLGGVDENSINKMSDFETKLRFGLSKKGVTALKQMVGETIYLPYSQTITQFEILARTNPIKEYTYIGVLESQNFMEDEMELLSKILRGKHATVTYKPTNIRANNIPILRKTFSKNVREVELTKVFETRVRQPLKQIYEENKIDPKNISQVSTAILSIFNNFNDNIALLQIISAIPGIDSKFITKLCDIASRENAPLLEFVEKYQNSFSEKTSEKLLPVINYLNKVHGRLDKWNGNSIMIHFLNFFKILNVQPYKEIDVKQHLINMHMSFKRLQEMSSNSNLIDRYLENNGYQTVHKSVLPKPPPSPSMSGLAGTIKVNLPATINVKPEIISPPVMLRRTGSSKCKARPRSWHAGNIFNVARKLR